MARTARTWKGARTPSALKRARQSLRRRTVNRRTRSQAKTLVQQANDIALGRSDGNGPEAVAAAISALDKAAEQGIIHRNNAARRKSRLMTKVNAAHLLDGEAGAASPARQEADDRQQDRAAQEGRRRQGLEGRGRQGSRSAANRGRQGQGRRHPRQPRVGRRGPAPGEVDGRGRRDLVPGRDLSRVARRRRQPRRTRPHRRAPPRCGAAGCTSRSAPSG